MKMYVSTTSLPGILYFTKGNIIPCVVGLPHCIVVLLQPP